MRGELKILLKNIIYVIIWFSVSMVSSFRDILTWKWGFINDAESVEMFLKNVVTPLVIWALAFVCDYTYVVLGMDSEKEKERKICRVVTYVCAILSLVALVIAINYSTLICRWAVLVIYMIVLVALKSSSLYSIVPIKKRQKRKQKVKDVAKM